LFIYSSIELHIDLFTFLVGYAFVVLYKYSLGLQITCSCINFSKQRLARVLIWRALEFVKYWSNCWCMYSFKWWL